MTIFASLLIAGGLLFVARFMWRLGVEPLAAWTEQDDRDYAALCESERGA